MSIENIEVQTINQNIKPAHKVKQKIVNRLTAPHFIINSIIIITALTGLGFKGAPYFIYNQIMSLLYGASAIFFYWSTREHDNSILFWHQTLHWIGLMIITFILSMYIRSGIITSSQAGLTLLLFLAFSLFLSGLYGHISFMLSGLYIMTLTLITTSLPNHRTETYLAATGLFLISLFIVTLITKK